MDKIVNKFSSQVLIWKIKSAFMLAISNTIKLQKKRFYLYIKYYLYNIYKNNTLYHLT